jgi:hypothetical protein
MSASTVSSSMASLSTDRRYIILACAVIEKEISPLRDDRVDMKFLDYGLHRTPENMRIALQSEIDAISGTGGYHGIILGYGLCGNGTVGITPRKIPLIIPRVHDCISLFLGSTEAYRRESQKCPGTYYLTPGWIERGETPISKYESYVRSYGRERAEWVIHEELKNYTRIAFIRTGACPSMEQYRETARKNAEFLGIAYEELEGSPTLFRALIRGPWDEDFIILRDAEPVKQERFLYFC